jgi:CspA family cold shock protein
MYSINRMSSSNDSVTMPEATNSSERLIGRVKWFNNKAGYGFITVTDGTQSGTDIFAHHSAIEVLNQQYKYLVQGEYVEFSITSTQTGSHPFQASSICGIKGGKLMCETRNDFKSSRNAYKTSHNPVSEPVKMPRQQKAPTKPQPNNEEQKDWTLVKGNNSSTQDSGRQTSSGGRGGSGRGGSSGSGRGGGGRGRPRKSQTSN